MRRAIVAAALLAAGCSSSTDPEPLLSSSVATKDLRITAELESNGVAILATVTLVDRNGAAVTLSGDRLRLRDESGEVDFATYPGGHAALLQSTSTALVLSLERDEGTSVEVALPLPPGFTLAGPPDPSPLAEPFTFTWEGFDGAASVGVTSPCFTSVARQLAVDVGAYTIQPADLAFVLDLSECEVTAGVGRAFQTDVAAPELSGPVPLLAQQLRKVRFTGTH